MLDFIVSETKKVFLKGIKKYATKGNKEFKETSILLYLQGEAEDKEVGYMICYGHQPNMGVTMLEIMDVRFDLKGYSILVPPYIKKLLEGFVKEFQSEKVDVEVVYFETKDEDGEEVETVRFFLFNDGKIVKELDLEQLITL